MFLAFDSVSRSFQTHRKVVKIKSVEWEEKGVASQAKRAPCPLPLPGPGAPGGQTLHPVNHAPRPAHRAGRPVPSVTWISSDATCPLQSPVTITVTLSFPALFFTVEALRSVLGVSHSFLSTPSSSVSLRKRLGVPEGQAVPHQTGVP